MKTISHCIDIFLFIIVLFLNATKKTTISISYSVTIPNFQKLSNSSTISQLFHNYFIF